MLRPTSPKIHLIFSTYSGAHISLRYAKSAFSLIRLSLNFLLQVHHNFSSRLRFHSISSSLTIVAMFKSDADIRRGWGALEKSFEKWYTDNQEAINATKRRGAPLDAFDRLWSTSYPRKHQAAFDKWCDEWLGRHLERMSRPVQPKEFIQTVLNTNFTDTNSASNLF